MTKDTKTPPQNPSKSYHKQCPCGKVHIHVPDDPLDPESALWGCLGKSGVCGRAIVDAIMAFANILNKNQYITKKKMLSIIEGMTCQNAQGREVPSCMDVIATLLKDKVWIDEKE